MTQSLSTAECIEIERACERVVHAYSRALDLGDMRAAADCPLRGFALAGDDVESLAQLVGPRAH